MSHKIEISYRVHYRFDIGTDLAEMEIMKIYTTWNVNGLLKLVECFAFFFRGALSELIINFVESLDTALQVS